MRTCNELKASLRCHETEDWAERLLVVMMGIRSACRGDCSGVGFHLPGEFLTPQQPRSTDPTMYVERLLRHFSTIQPKPTTRHGDRPVFVYKDLQTSPYVFVYGNAPKGPLDNPFDDPFRVLSRHERHYIVKARNREVPISLDRLKPAYIASDEAPRTTTTTTGNATAPLPSSEHTSSSDAPVRTTRSGRRVRFVDRS